MQQQSFKYLATYKALKQNYRLQLDNAEIPSSFLKFNASRYWPKDGAHSTVFNQRFPDIETLVQMADMACQRRIIYWHPWHMEVTHKPYRLKKNINWFSPPNGDDEWIDSLVRFNHMIDLAAAYQLTANCKYLASFQSYLSSFHESRQKKGRHWKFLINVAVRLINLIRAYDLICRVEHFPESTHFEVLENIFLDVEFLLNALEETRANGAFFASTALLIAAEFLKEYVDVETWRIKAQTKLDQTIKTEIQSDAIEVEQVPMYHGQVALALLDYCVALKANDQPIDTTLEHTIAAMLEALAAICDPQSAIPAIGDSDRFTIDYLVDFYHEVFASKRIINKIDYFAEIKSNSHQKEHLTTMEASGWLIVRWLYDNQKLGYLFFDCSGKPKNKKSGHSHCDDLQFLLHTSSGAVFTDPGRFTYCPQPKHFVSLRQIPVTLIKNGWRPMLKLLAKKNWRASFKRTLAHNTISFNGLDQPGYQNRLDPRSLTLYEKPETTDSTILLKGYLDTSIESDDNIENKKHAGGYQHERSLLGILPNIWIIIDQLTSTETGDWTSSYHLDAGGEASQTQNGSIMLKTPGGDHSMHFLSDHPTSHSIKIDDDWVSHIYNKKNPSKTVRLKIPSTAKATLITLLLAEQQDTPQLEEFIRIKTENIDFFKLKIIENNISWTIFINPQKQIIRHKGFEWDAFAAYQKEKAEKVISTGFLSGSFFRSTTISINSTASESSAYQTFPD